MTVSKPKKYRPLVTNTTVYDGPYTAASELALARNTASMAIRGVPNRMTRAWDGPFDFQYQEIGAPFVYFSTANAWYNFRLTDGAYPAMTFGHLWELTDGCDSIEMHISVVTDFNYTYDFRFGYTYLAGGTAYSDISTPTSPLFGPQLEKAKRFTWTNGKPATAAFTARLNGITAANTRGSVWPQLRLVRTNDNHAVELATYPTVYLMSVSIVNLNEYRRTEGE